MKQTILFVLLLYSGFSFSQAGIASLTPGTLNTGGGTTLVATDFSTDWSIGESTLIETYIGKGSSGNGSLPLDWNITSGILQPYDNKHIIFNHLIRSWSAGEVKLFPVPTPDKIFIDFRSVTTGKIIIQLMSIDGKMHGSMEFNHVNGNSIRSWDLTNKAPGKYLFKITLTNSLGAILKQGTFQVEKIN